MLPRKITTFALLTITVVLFCVAQLFALDRAEKKYRPVVKKLENFIEYQMKDKDLPSLSFALVDGDKVVWSTGFGDAKPDIKADGQTIYRIASLSKLFTAMSVMQLVEQGKLDLDVPIQKYLPDFQPHDPFGKAITLRQLMSHRSGLVREPPVGHYFDRDGPTLAQLVSSLNYTSLIYAPETRTKYSNAAVSVEGFIVEKVARRPFDEYLQDVLLNPMGMTGSGFAPREDIVSRLADGFLWTFDGRQFPAPIFELGMMPAAGMYASVDDLAKFLITLINGGKGSGERVLQAETLRKMWEPQFQPAGSTSGFGLGFYVSQFEGTLKIGHGGVMYGYATRIAALPDEKLGAVCIITIDCANSVAGRINTYAFQLMRAMRAGKPLPKYGKTESVPWKLAEKIKGVFANDKRQVEIEVRNPAVVLTGAVNQHPLKLWKNDTLITDGRLAYGAKVFPLADNRLVVSGDTLTRQADLLPAEIPQRWRGLIGEYGWDHDVLYILEKRGQLYCLIEWFDYYPLQEISANVFAFPDYGLYHGEKLLFHRDPVTGKAGAVEAASVLFERRDIGLNAGETFRITPVKPISELRTIAAQASPPAEKPAKRQPDLVDLATLGGGIKFDIRYASSNNFMGEVFYPQPRAFLQRLAAEALLRANDRLRSRGLGIIIYDAYRPWYVTKMFWDATPQDKKIFVANPANGSRHNRGCAVDMGLYDLRSGKAVAMVSGYDEFEALAYADYPGGTERQRWYRRTLRDAMEAEGFTVYPAEWWHFDYQHWREYPILNLRFDEIKPQ